MSKRVNNKRNRVKKHFRRNPEVKTKVRNTSPVRDFDPDKNAACRLLFRWMQ